MEFSPSFFSKPDKTPQKEDASLISRIRDSQFVRAGMVAVGLHGAVLGGHELKERVAHTAEISRRWLDPDSVLRPQTDEQEADIRSRINERSKRKDEKGIADYKLEVEKRLDSGESVFFEDLYFKQAELNGVAREDILKAKSAMEGLVRYFSAKLENGLTDDEIRDISRTMFDSTEYEWGQGSVVDFFIKHKRNCVSIEQAQEIVFDRLFNLLPEQEKDRFHLGVRFENQHRIAVVGISSESKKDPERFIVLQPSFDVERAGNPPAGTAMASSDQIKASFAGKKVVINATKRTDGGKVNPGPRIDFVTNQPVGDGIVVEGVLRSAVANEKQAKEEGLVPMTGKEYRERYQKVMEIESIVIDQGNELEDAKDQSESGIHRRVMDEMNRNIKLNGDARVNLRDFSSPEIEAIEFFNNFPYANISPIPVFGDLSKWDAEAVEALVNLDVKELSISLDRSGRIRADFILALEKAFREPRSYWDWSILEIRQFESSDSKKIETAQLVSVLMPLNKLKRELKLDVESLSHEDFNVLERYPPRALHITKRMDLAPLPSDDADVTKKKIEESYALRHLKLPVYLEVNGIAKKPNETSEDYAWMFDGYSGSVFPEFFSLAELVRSEDWKKTRFGNSLKIFASDVDSSLEQPLAEPKAVLLLEFVRGAHALCDQYAMRVNFWRDVEDFYSTKFVHFSGFEKERSGKGRFSSVELAGARRDIKSFFKDLEERYK